MIDQFKDKIIKEKQYYSDEAC